MHGDTDAQRLAGARRDSSSGPLSSMLGLGLASPLENDPPDDPQQQLSPPSSWELSQGWTERSP